MNVREVAELLGKTEAIIRNRVARGQIPFIRTKHGRSIYFDVKEIYRMMDEGHNDPRGRG